MSIERERFGSGFVPPWVVREHDERYRHAATFVHQRKVLDCACGAGFGARSFLAEGPTALVAVDVSQEAVRQTLERAPGAAILRGSATSLPIASGTLDLAISLETMEHVEDDAAYLAEISRVLSPSGIFVCSTPNRAVTNPGASLAHRPFNRFHVREYSQGEFQALLAERFGEVEILGQTPCPRWRVGAMAGLGRLFGPRIAARIAQALKLPRFLWDQPGRYAVRPQDPRVCYEYLVAVCRAPRSPA
ncbi:MAG: class I SAM-dependent methyltransferase [Anaeromyxobacteraceae bacterium]